MQPYVINVTEIEELQTIRNRQRLDQIFSRARTTVVNGEAVILTRKFPGGRSEKFDEITTEQDLETYKNSVYKYL